jgi:lysophospholipase L1-like esterase
MISTPRTHHFILPFVLGLFASAVLASALPARETPQQSNQAPAPSGNIEIPANDNEIPGTGTIRRFGWFQKLWNDKRSKWAKEVADDQDSIVFLGDSITQGWGPNFRRMFPDLNVVNRGISGDTTRGMLLRLSGDVIALNPTGVVMLMGTNDLEEGDTPESIANNVKAIVDNLEKHDPRLPIIFCKVFPSSARMRRPAASIKRINELCIERLKDNPQVTIVDTWSIFADNNGDAQVADFPDLLHPNKIGYEKWAAALRPSLAAIKTIESAQSSQAHPNRVVWEGAKGPGQGKHIVFIAGDHEYRGEETLPALARILAKHHGFKCTFLVTTNKDTGDIEPGSNHITGLEALKTADLMVVFLRFQRFTDDQMQHIEDYLQSGKPVIGLRTSTHGFQGLSGKFAKYNEGYKGDDDRWRHGFGEEILGEHWVGHFGRNHQQSSRLVLEDDQRQHPILRGVQQPHAMSAGYVGHPKDGVTLARVQVLDGMTPESPPTTSEHLQSRLSAAWTRTYNKNDPKSRVFATTHGASEDLLNDDFRRMMLNAHYWCLGMEREIKADSPIEFVGPYRPTTFNFGGHRKGIKPSHIAGWDSAIYKSTDTKLDK